MIRLRLINIKLEYGTNKFVTKMELQIVRKFSNNLDNKIWYNIFRKLNPKLSVIMRKIENRRIVK